MRTYVGVAKALFLKSSRSLRSAGSIVFALRLISPYSYVHIENLKYDTVNDNHVTVNTQQKLEFMLPRDVTINTAMIKISVQLTNTSDDNYTIDTRAIIPYFAWIITPNTGRYTYYRR